MSARVWELRCGGCGRLVVKPRTCILLLHCGVGECKPSPELLAKVAPQYAAQHASMNKKPVPSVESVVAAIEQARSNSAEPVTLSVLCDALFPDTRGMGPVGRASELRLVDRGLQASRAARKVSYTRKGGWVVGS